MRIAWDQYEEFTRCPQWWAWSHRTDFVTPPSPNHPQKDTQWLARGNVIQDLVDQWCLESRWLGSVKDDENYYDTRSTPIINVRFEEAVRTGSPQTNPSQMEMELRSWVLRAFQSLRNLISDSNAPAQSLPKVKTQWKLEALHPYIPELELVAIPDIMIPVGHTEKYLIVEGKATSRPGNTNDSQLRWQIEVAKLQGINLIDTHFYLFYATGQFFPVSNRDSRHSGWLSARDDRLREMVAGYSKANPSPSNCRICPHQYRCPDKHIPVKRTDLEPFPSSTRTITSALD
jgi:hypothetical protein